MTPQDIKQFAKDKLYLDLAFRIAKESKCNRLKVGAIIEKDNNIISFAWNGTAKGRPNCCEDENGNTKLEVVHSEQNAFYKLSRQGSGSCQGATLYMTDSPCEMCAPAIIQNGITRVVYVRPYRNQAGLQILKDAGIEIIIYPDHDYSL